MEVESIKVEHRLEQFKAAAKDAGVKLTHQRLEIFREVASSLEHLDAKTVFRSVQARMPTVSLDTVYRTLWMLNDLGIITTLGPRCEIMRFDANLEPHHHHVCTRCGSVRDFESVEFNALRVPDAVKELGSVVAMHVEVRGICDSCARDQTEESVPRNPGQPRGPKRRRT